MLRARAPLVVYPVVCLLGCLGLTLAPPALAQNNPAFHGVGDLPGGATTSIALDVSGNGSVVVGGSESTAGAEAFRWTGPGTLQGLGALDPGGEFYSVATGVSANGSVIVGTSADGDGRAFRWTSGGGIVGLNRFSCFGCPTHAAALGVSGNGLVAVGSGAGGSIFSPWVQAARWTGGGTSISGIGWLSGGGSASVAQAASDTGSVIVGESDSSSGTRAFAWASGSGMIALPGIPGALVASIALDTTATGSMVVGAANGSTITTSRLEPVRWSGTNWQTLTHLGMLPGTTVPGGRAEGVTGDGALIVGSAKNAAGDDVAFVWDDVNGMRELKQVLIDEYGLAVEGWTLQEARGVSDVNTAGEFTVVGAGVNPQGVPEGWVAFLSPTACNDGIDNDGDLAVDHPADSGCLRPSDRSEGPNCSDGLDNDGDGASDGADAECTGPADNSEEADCSDGVDSDADGLVDYPADPGCRDAAGLIENPACDDGIDDDGDTKTDHPFDLQCTARDDASELADCSDGLDNDGDGLTDGADTDCSGPTDQAEDPACSDRIDNDANGKADYPDEFPKCVSAADAREAPQCSDGVDNDGDGQADAADPQCSSPLLPREDPGRASLGDLLVVDRPGARLVGLDPATGTQRLLSEDIHLADPQGVALRATGEAVVADPGALVEVDPISGAQRLAGPPFDDLDSLQVVFDSNGDAIVLERMRLVRVPWQSVGWGVPTTLLQLPTPSLSLTAFIGYSLAREASGMLLVTGIGAPGNGIHRVDPATGAVSVVTPGLNSYTFNDIAVEPSGSIVVVGRVGSAMGVFRVNASTGALTTLTTSALWKTPTGVAVDASWIYVADAGTCGASGCAGSEVVRVHPTSGARVAVWSGPLLSGQMDLALVDHLPACRDALDNDADLLVDFPADSHCTAPSHPTEAPACSDALDNDGDGAVDGADPGCGGLPSAPREDPQCSDGLDNDGDLKVDWNGAGIADPDPECQANPAAAESSGCGIGFELVGLALCGRALRRRARRLSAKRSPRAA